MLKTILLIGGISVLGWIATMILFSVFSPIESLGLKEGKLTPCPGTPNCVCSEQDEGEHAIASLRFTGDPAAAWKRLIEVLGRQPRFRIVTEEPEYLHVECRSQLFRFVDDLECRLDREKERIQVRSASRAGRSDLGVNRGVETIRREFEKE